MEQTNGFFRRFLFVMFEVTIPEWKKNPNLAKEIIEDELSGVFNWVLEGLQRILEPGRQGFTYSAQKIDKANREFERTVTVLLCLCQKNIYSLQVQNIETQKSCIMNTSFSVRKIAMVL